MNSLAIDGNGDAAIAMAWWVCGLWGIFGGLGIEAWEFYGVVRRHGLVPWKIEGEAGFWPFVVSVGIRGGLGCGLAVACGQTDQVSGPVGAIAVGVAAPFIFEQLRTTRLPRGDSIHGPMPETLPVKPLPQPRKKSSTKKANSGSRDGH